MKLKLFLFNFKNMLKGTLIYKLRPFKLIGRGEHRRLNTYFKACRIQHHLACPHELMGSVERRHRQIVDMGLALLAHSNLPKPYWEDAFLIATYIIHHLPSKALNNKSPFEMTYNNNKKNPTICLCVFLEMPVGQTCRLITNIKLISDLKLVFFLAIDYQTKATNISIWLQENYVSCHVIF